MVMGVGNDRGHTNGKDADRDEQTRSPRSTAERKQRANEAQTNHTAQHIWTSCDKAAVELPQLSGTWPYYRSGPLVRLGKSRPVLVVVEDAYGIAVEVVILMCRQRPKEGSEACAAHRQGEDYEDHNIIHDMTRGRLRSALSLRCSLTVQSLDNRSALPITIIDDRDMKIAAISGVTWPASAIGTAITL